MKIILGRTRPTNFGEEETYQAFGALLVNQTGVSNMHATITIDDNGEWWLEDQWSTNGTYIREDDGRFRRIGNHEYPGNCKITPMTFIRLGTDDTSGCCFYAKQAEQYGNFNNEFEFIKKKDGTIIQNSEKHLKMLKISKMVLRILPALIVVIWWWLFDKSQNGFIMKMIIVPIANSLIEFTYNTNEKKKEFEEKTKEQKKLFSLCPNPKCNHILSDREIANLQCNICGISHN